MSWFKRVKEGIVTATKDKKETPDGLWSKCPACDSRITTKELKDNLYVCSACNYHFRINSIEYFQILFDDQEFRELNKDLASADPLHFTDKKPYNERLKEAQAKSHLTDAIRTAHGKLNGVDIVVGAMDFSFIGGSMGAVVGEKIARAIDFSLKKKFPFIMISKSGGARMMEAAHSLMQMAKTSAKLALLDRQKIPYISILTDPTTGGVTASFAMLGDINIAEPGALIGFAGPRVIKETIGRDLPKGFQSSEFLLEHGFLDYIVDRKDLKDNLSTMLGHFGDSKVKAKTVKAIKAREKAIAVA
ncbi:MAG: acetyl-CoA carboxylase, carboxyltransferase subunit beta [Bacteroidia bacterium]